MATVSKGIPEDTPENSIRAITEILKEEAESIGAKFEVDEKMDNAGRMVTIDLQRGGEWLRVYVQCIDSECLAPGHGTIGEGSISWNPGGPSSRLVLEMFHGCPPYRWSVYPGHVQVASTKPTDYLLRFKEIARATG